MYNKADWKFDTNFKILLIILIYATLCNLISNMRFSGNQ